MPARRPKRPPLIQISELSKIYGLGDAVAVALEEVNLTVKEGEFLAVMGPSGCGKSTLLNITGLLDVPTHGQYLLEGRNVAGLSPNRRARLRRDTFGFIFQSFYLLPKLTALENVALPLAYKGVRQTRRLKRASAILERVGLAEREYFYPHQLGGGQCQRVAIARALINDPKIVIADEPTGNLDSRSSRLVMELLADAHKAGNTVILVTHNPALTRYAERVIFMHDGSVIAEEKTPIGEIPTRLRRSMYFMPRRTADDQLAGVSALMRAIPEGRSRGGRSPTAKARTFKEASKSKVKKAARGQR